MFRRELALLVGFLFIVSFQVAAEVEGGPEPIASTSPGKVMEQRCEGLLTGHDLDLARSSWSGHTIILDTNVILNDPYAIHKFGVEGARVVIPGVVLNELDDKKNDPSLGRPARMFSRLVDNAIRQGGDITKGLKLESGGTLILDVNDYTGQLKASTLDRKKNDTRIIAAALSYTKAAPHRDDVVLVSDDINMRVMAATQEVKAIPFEYDWVVESNAAQTDQNYVQFRVTKEQLGAFLESRQMPLPEELKLRPNAFVQLVTDDFDGSIETLARYVFDRENPSNSGLRALRDFSDLPFPPRNIEQALAMDVEFDPTVDLVILISEMGTGKSLVTLQAGLVQVPKEYREMKLTQTLSKIGHEDLGAYPGDPNMKLSPWMEHYRDTFKVILDRVTGSKTEGPKGGPKPAKGSELFTRIKRALGGVASDLGSIPKVELVSFSHLRGRNLPYSFIVFDEVQNATPLNVKTLITRAAEGSKVILLGDPSQIDVPYLNANNNGLSVAVAAFTSATLSDVDRSHVAVVRLREGVRSDLSDLGNRAFNEHAKLKVP